MITNFFYSIILFLRDEWLWSMTWGWYQISLGLLCTWFLFMYQCRIKSLPSLILTVASYWVAFVLYTVLVVGVLGSLIATDQMPERILYNYYMVSIGLAIIFSTLQSIFFVCINRWYHKRSNQIVKVIFAGNIVAAIIATYLMRSSFATI